MDRTSEFLQLAGDSVPKFSPNLPSLFLIKAENICSKVCSFGKFIRKWRVAYVNYNRYLPKHLLPVNMSGLSEDEKAIMDRNALSFIASSASEIQELRQQIEEEGGSALVNSEYLFQKAVVQFMVEKLNTLTKAIDKMQKERASRRLLSYRLISDDFVTLHETIAGKRVDAINAPTIPAHENHISPVDSSSKTHGTFSQRYVDEIASLSKLKEYNDIAAIHRQALLKESKIMRNRFGNEYQEAQRMERTVSGISGMIGEFAALIESQSEMVEGVESASKEATSRVRQTDEQLQLTLERSESHQWSMTALLLTLSITLLLLDFLSP